MQLFTGTMPTRLYMSEYRKVIDDAGFVAIARRTHDEHPRLGDDIQITHFCRAEETPITPAQEE
jgi:hypothetical protein